MAAPNPSVGINAETGGRVDGWQHVIQSVQDVLTTRFGSRLMREWYGSLVLEALGRNITRNEIVPVIASITSALEQWEPRFFVEEVQIGGEIRAGRLTLTILGRYRPRALLGDLSEEGDKRINLSLGPGAVSVE